MTIGRKQIGWGTTGIAALALIAFALRPTPVPVDVTAVARGPLQVTIDEEGRTRVRDRYIVVAPVAGRVARITFEEGT